MKVLEIVAQNPELEVFHLNPLYDAFKNKHGVCMNDDADTPETWAQHYIVRKRWCSTGFLVHAGGQGSYHIHMRGGSLSFVCSCCAWPNDLGRLGWEKERLEERHLLWTQRYAVEQAAIVFQCYKKDIRKLVYRKPFDELSPGGGMSWTVEGIECSGGKEYIKNRTGTEDFSPISGPHF